MSQQFLADRVGVSVRAVKRWENPRAIAYRVAPDDVWDVLENYLSLQEDIVEDYLQLAYDSISKTPADISLPYWHNSADYELEHPGQGEYWQMANANNRLIAFYLKLDGHDVNFSYGGANQ